SRPRWVALPEPSTSTNMNGGVSGVTVTTPSRRPLKGTCSPASVGPARTKVARKASTRQTAGWLHFMTTLHGACDRRMDIAPGAQAERRAVLPRPWMPSLAVGTSEGVGPDLAAMSPAANWADLLAAVGGPQLLRMKPSHWRW